MKLQLNFSRSDVDTLPPALCVGLPNAVASVAACEADAVWWFLLEAALPAAACETLDKPAALSTSSLAEL
jgi:hypothetical protein